jgi:hypothetical protein
MKKILFTFISVCTLCVSLKAQTNTATPATNPVDQKEENFDKKFRFGIRATPQPTWYKSDNINSTAAGANFGFGFGLIMEFKLSKIIHFSTGIGGDFEGGYINYRNENDFSVNAVLNSEGQYIETNKGVISDDIKFGNGNTQVVLKDRQYKSTMITIPFVLKMMTEEYSGARYFAMFGGELGIRAGLKANDTYISGVKSVVSGTTLVTTPIDGGDLTRSKIDLNKDGSLVPMRLGMNLGLGTEYRLGGSTSLLFSVNYFQSFTNLMKNDSKYLVKTTNTSVNPLNQGYFMRAIRINVGLLF